MDFRGPLVADWQARAASLKSRVCLLTQTIWTRPGVHPLAPGWCWWGGGRRRDELFEELLPTVGAEDGLSS